MRKDNWQRWGGTGLSRSRYRGGDSEGTSAVIAGSNLTAWSEASVRAAASRAISLCSSLISFTSGAWGAVTS